ncbi:putative glutaredoxin, Thioredoxin-like superfamily [Dioscorea sansibarensis]
MESVGRLASQRAEVVFSKSSCCMCLAVKTFLSNLSFNGAVYELDNEEPNGREMERTPLGQHAPSVTLRRCLFCSSVQDW